MKKQLQLSTAAILATSAVVAVAGPAPTAEAATYKDVPKHANFHVALQELSKEGIITGYADGTFKPNASITRGQVAKILTRLLELQPSSNMQFSDVAKDHDFYQYASAVVAAGYMDKKNGKFNAKQTLTRNEYAEILMKAFDLQSKTVDLPFLDVNPQYRTAIQAVYANKLMTGTSKSRFNGAGEVKRSHIVLTLHKAMQLQKVEESKPPNENKITFTIDKIETTAIVDEDGEKYHTTTELQQLFRSSNAAVLQDAEVEASVENGRITAISKLTVYNPSSIWRSSLAARQLDTVVSSTTARTLNGNNGIFSFPIIVDGANVTLKNMTLPSVETGEDAVGALTLDNVTVQNRLIINDGYSRTFQLNSLNSSIIYLEIMRDRTTVQGHRKLPKVFISDEAYDVTLNTAVGRLQFERDGYFTLYGTGSIDVLQLAHATDIFLRNTSIIKKLIIDHKDAEVRLWGNSHITEAIIPVNAAYNEVFGYPSSIRNYISKIYHPNSSLNLLAAEVVKPSKEEIAFQRAVDNVLKNHEHVVTDNRLTLRTGFNEILPTMKTLGFEQRLYLVGSTNDLTEVPISYYKNNVLVGEKTITISELQSGLSVEDLFTAPKTLENFTTNSNISYTVQFNTARELKLRSTVFVRGVAKHSEESVVNAGNEQLIAAAYTASIRGYTSETTNNIVTTSLAFNKISDIIKPNKLGHIVKLHTELPANVTQIPLKIRKGGVELFAGNVSVADLKAGLLTSTLASVQPETFGQFSDNSITDYEYEFGVLDEMDVSISLAVDGNLHAQGTTEKINAGNADALASLPVAYKAQALSNKALKVTFDAVATVPAVIESMPIGVKLTLKDETAPTKKIRLQVKANGQTGIAELTVDQLKAGVNILEHTTFAGTYTPLTLKDLAAAKDIEIEVLTTLSGKLTAETTVGSLVKGTTTDPNELNIQFTEQLDTTTPKPGTSTPETQGIIDSFSVSAAKNGLQVKTKFGAGASTAGANEKIDARIMATNGINPAKNNEIIYVTVYFNGTVVKSYAPITYKELLDGKYLSAIIGQPPALLNTHASGREDTWDIVVHDFTAPVDVTVTLFKYEQQNNQTPLYNASNTLNYKTADELESLVNSFTLTKNDKVYTLNAEFTATENIDATWTTSFIVKPKAMQQIATPINTTVARIEGTTTIAAASTVNLTDAGIDTSALQLTGQVAGTTPAYKLVKNLSAAPSKWQFTFNAAPPAMEAQFKVNDYIVKTVDETPTP